MVVCDQCVDASSKENSTPPMGAPNAAASPDATPAERKSLPSISLKKVSRKLHARTRRDLGGLDIHRCRRVKKEATAAPTCTSGPPGHGKTRCNLSWKMKVLSLKVVIDNDELKEKFGDSILTYRSIRCRRPDGNVQGEKSLGT